VDEGLKHAGTIRRDELVSILKYRLTAYIGMLPDEKLTALGSALSIAADID
jgi:mRNA-degrading endonuclease toxin of MazEF toxin-antitoxin module